MVSVVVPMYNEELALPHTLDAPLRQEGSYEAIHVDGGSSDRTRGIAESFGFIDGADNPDHSALPLASSCDGIVQHDGSCRILPATKGRASQMNAGAKPARGPMVAVSSADTILPKGAI